MSAPERNVDPLEIERFGLQAYDWWDLKGPLKALHDINPLRIRYIADRAGIRGKTILDVGCGGGILSEALALAGGIVSGIDVTDSALAAARRHLAVTKAQVDYRRMTVEGLSRQTRNHYDMATCMELLEHVPRPDSVLTACAALIKPGGDLFVATVNRTWASLVLVKFAAEYLLKVVRRGTHTYDKFLRPDEVVFWAESAGLTVSDLSGFSYNPFTGKARLSGSTKMNYLMHLKKGGE